MKRKRSSSPGSQHHFEKDLLLGLAVGDALGLPVEYTVREDLEIFPVTGMKGYGTHQQAPGTWSDNSGLSFCLSESIAHGYDPEDLARRMLAWLEEGYWTPHGKAFDVASSVKKALMRFKEGVHPSQAGGQAQHHSGNGSLTRVLPLIFHTQNLSLEERWKVVSEVSSITHGHLRPIFSCFILTEVARGLIEEATAPEAYVSGIAQAKEMANALEMNPAELRLFERILDGRLADRARFQIHSSGYVLHSLEAALWSWLTTDSYESAVLTAVNLGADTDSVASICGGLAGLTYGYREIPMDWLSQLARKAEIMQLAEWLAESSRGNGGFSQEGMVA
ncbi:MAG: ADP-ribosylglycohydrolase family protein [Bacteroidota bacterium]